MVEIISSFEIGPEQADGRKYVKETHKAEDKVYDYEYLWDGSIDPSFIMEERAAILTSAIEGRIAAKSAVIGTSIPLTKYEFLSRFNIGERIAIRELAKTDPVVQDYMEMMSLSENISLPIARPGLQYLVSSGTLTELRASEIGAE